MNKYSNYNNIEAFENDKQRLKLECESLEMQIDQKWHSFKISLRPKNIGNQLLSNWIESKKNNLLSDFLAPQKLIQLFSSKTAPFFKKLKSLFN
jgi:hypothetical protein